MEHSYESQTVANAFLELAESKGKTITPMQLNKLVYIADGFFAGNTGNPLIRDPIEAWKYGPVIPSLYHDCKKYGNGVITHKLISLQEEMGGEPQTLSRMARKLIDKVYELYGDLTGIELSKITHQNGTPWSLTYDGSKNKEIPHDIIEEYYKSMIASSRD